MRGSQIATLSGIVERGLGITFTPRIAVETHKNRAVSFHTISPEPSREIRLVWMRLHRLSLRQKQVLNIVESLFKAKDVFH